MTKSARWYAVVFLSPECPLANAAIPVLNSLSKEFSSQGVVVVGAYVDHEIALDAFKAHAKDYGITFVTVDDRQHRLVHLAKATYTPQVAVFAADGRILYRGRIDDRVGDFGEERPSASHNDLHDVLAQLVSGKSGPFAYQRGFGCAIPGLDKEQ